MLESCRQIQHQFDPIPVGNSNQAPGHASTKRWKQINSNLRVTSKAALPITFLLVASQKEILLILLFTMNLSGIALLLHFNSDFLREKTQNIFQQLGTWRVILELVNISIRFQKVKNILLATLSLLFYLTKIVCY